jgi:hypothetical protein
MRPRIHVRLTPAEEALRASWSRRTLAACALIAAAMIVVSGASRQSGDAVTAARAEQPAALEACARWREAASDALSQMIPSKRDAELSHVADAIVRMRRALRNCEMGWSTLACQDYRAVARSVPGDAGLDRDLAFDCQTGQENHTVGSSRVSP